jgi:hypothetical protein
VLSQRVDHEHFRPQAQRLDGVECQATNHAALQLRRLRWGSFGADHADLRSVGCLPGRMMTSDDSACRHQKSVFTACLCAANDQAVHHEIVLVAHIAAARFVTSPPLAANWGLDIATMFALDGGARRSLCLCARPLRRPVSWPEQPLSSFVT